MDIREVYNVNIKISNNVAAALHTYDSENK